MKVFFDTNILIDVLANRHPFYEDSAAMWTLSEKRTITGLVSALTFTNTFYIVRRLTDLKTARRALTLIRDSFTPVACDGDIIDQAIASRFSDFEDAVQYISAKQVGADCLVSRNVSHFPGTGSCPVLTPAEFLAAHSFEA
ncbi:MAG: PIN domain-containing protein [Planctomycetaceae bacterium]|nr:PIN domain-containing protein [Planctomycetaceae bacterium]